MKHPYIARNQQKIIPLTDETILNLMPRASRRSPRPRAESGTSGDSLNFSESGYPAVCRGKTTRGATPFYDHVEGDEGIWRYEPSVPVL